MDPGPQRVAVAGLGMMGHVAVLALRRDPRWEVVAVADPSAAARERSAALVPEAAALDDARALVQPDELDRHGIDVVVVATPPDSHAALAVAALDAGRHVLCEKPMAVTVTEARAMADAARRAGTQGVVAVVDHQLRYARAQRWIRDRLAEGAVGAVHHVQVVATFPALRATGWTWWSSRARGGGLLNEYGSHTVDLLQWWLGPAASATGTVRTVVDRRPDADGRPGAVDSDDLASFRLTWPDGAFADVLLSGVASRAERTIAVHGDGGTLVLDADARVSWDRPGGSTTEVHDLAELDPSLLGDPDETYTQPFARLLADLAPHLASGTRPPDAAGFDDGLSAVEALAAVRASSPPPPPAPERP